MHVRGGGAATDPGRAAAVYAVGVAEDVAAGQVWLLERAGRAEVLALEGSLVRLRLLDGPAEGAEFWWAQDALTRLASLNE